MDESLSSLEEEEDDETDAEMEEGEDVEDRAGEDEDDPSALLTPAGSGGTKRTKLNQSLKGDVAALAEPPNGVQQKDNRLPVWQSVGNVSGQAVTFKGNIIDFIFSISNLKMGNKLKLY